MPQASQAVSYTHLLDEVVGADAKPVSLRASEAISDEHPVEVSFDLAKDSEQAPKLGGMVINVPASGDHASEAGRLLVELTDGTVREIGISRAEARAAFFRSSAPTAVIDENGTVVVDFGGQIAVKTVSYTHLDVYKRQAIFRLVKRLRVFRAFPSLLASV